MSQQNTSAPPGAWYSSLSEYSPFAPSNAQSPSNTSNEYQQSQIPNYFLPTSQPNDTPLNRNPPIPSQQSLFSFPPAPNPEMFKHFPPPPLPPGNYAPSPSNMFSPFSRIEDHNTQLFTAHSLLPSGGPSGHMSMLSQNQSSHTQDIPSNQNLTNIITQSEDRPLSSIPHQQNVFREHEGHTDGLITDDQNRSNPFLRNDGTHSVGTQNSSSHLPLTNTRLSHEKLARDSRDDNGSPMQNLQTAAPAAPKRGAISPPSYDPSLKEKAKAAMLAMISYNITYKDLVVEGISANTLRQLYHELGLKQPEAADPRPNSGTVAAEPPAKTAHSAQAPHKSVLQNQAKALGDNKSVSATAESSIVNSNLERKDRIAQLLAAKAAKGSSVGLPSPSASPAPTPGTTPASKFVPEHAASITESVSALKSANISAADKAALQEAVRQRLEQMKKNVTTNDLASNSAQSGVLALPTPVRESLVESGLSSMIPGLFMLTDEKRLEYPSAVPSTDIIVSKRTTQALQDQRKSSLPMKRPVASDSFDGTEEQNSKRQALSKEGSVDIEMEIDGSESGEASEGEIIEDESPSVQKEHYDGRGASEKLQPATKISKPLGKAQVASNIARQGSGLKSPLSAISGNLPLNTAFSPSPNLLDPMQTKQTSSSRPLSKLSATQLAVRAAKLKAELMRQRRIRQQQLSDGVPPQDDQVLKTQQYIEQSKQRLAEIRAELEKHEAEAARARESERALLEEIERLEQQLQESALAGKQSPSTRTPDNHSEPESKAPTAAVEYGATSSARLSTDELLGDDAQELEPTSSTQVSTPAVLNNQTEIPISTETRLQQSASDFDVSQPPANRDTRGSSDDLLDVTPSNEQAEDDSADHSALPEAVALTLANTNGPENLKNSTPQRHESHDHDNTVEDHSVISEDSEMSIDEDSAVESGGSASMSDSGSDDYEPAEPEDPHVERQQREDSEEYNPEDTFYEAQAAIDNAEDYERSASVESRTPATDPDRTSVERAVDLEDEQEQSQALAVVTSTPANMVEYPKSAQEVLKPQTLAESLEIVTNPHHTDNEPIVIGEDLVTQSQFMPYHSPLSSFKSYRFHPSFNQDVKTGYRSLTYSNNIDPRTPLCPTELTGEVCTDPDCQEQHFGSMALTDDKILVQMSSANDIKDKALRDDYLMGLKQVITSLRQNGAKEFSEVANALSQYRRDWSALHLDF